VFLEKALAHPEIEFVLYSDDKLKFHLHPKDFLQRYAEINSTYVHVDLLSSQSFDFEDISIDMVISSPTLHRRDRRYMQVYVNGRQIQEYGLMQAIEYGYNRYLPGGAYPYAAIFIRILPSLVDFNIHPAKREIRFRNKAAVHKAVVNAVNEVLQKYTIKKGESFSFEPAPLFESQRREQSNKGRDNHYASNTQLLSGFTRESSAAGSKPNWTDLSDTPQKVSQKPQRADVEDSETIHYYGQLFDGFLLAAVEENFYIIDQHAAHEKILFEKLKQGKLEKQHLLVPVLFDVTRDEAQLIEKNIAFYEKLGLEIRSETENRFSLQAVPADFQGMTDELVEFIRSQRGTDSDLLQKLFANTACKKAVKDGEVLDSNSARKILEDTFKLEDARCPHGRPIWYSLSRDELFQIVGRT
jgi:DNA mismatch repair protein MutL